MPSPFPGMNPYLESDVWHGFHLRLVPACGDAVVPQVRPEFIVTLEENVYIHELPASVRVPLGRPDVSILKGGSQQAPTGGSAVAVDIERESYIEIRDRYTQKLVTAIEVLSPANKRPGPDRESYIAKRDRLLHSDANFVEIDLLRGWERMPAESIPPCDYCVLVSRVEERPHAGVWPIFLRDRLPVIPVPLTPSHPDAVLDLQDLLHQVYDRGAYADYLYSRSPYPPLSPSDVEWAKQLLPKTVT